MSLPLSLAYQDPAVSLYQGDCFDFLRSLEPNSVDAILTDPPYCSGGQFPDRMKQSTTARYVLNGTKKTYPEFLGEHRSMRGHLLWCVEWLRMAWRATRPGGVAMLFCDRRRIALTEDALEVAGWRPLSLIPWDKTEASRPQRGWFRAQCEYVVAAVKGTLGPEQSRPSQVCAPGLIRCPVDRDKRHATGKPVYVLQELMQVLAPGSRIVDPFAGSGTTLDAARSLGHMAAGCELAPDVIAEAQKYLAEKALPLCPVISPQRAAETGMFFPPLSPENSGNRVLPGSAGHLPG